MPRDRKRRHSGQQMDAHLKLATARQLARKRFPFYGGAFIKMVPVFVEPGSMGTIGILANYVMLIDPVFVDGLSVDEMEGIVCHEAMHPLRDHAGRRDKMGIDPFRMPAHAGLWNMAADAEINDDLITAGCTLPDGGGITPQKLGMEPGGTAEFYYRELLKKAQQCPKCGGTGTPQDGGGQGGQDGSQGDEGGKEGKGQGGGQKGSKGQPDASKGKGGGCPLCSGPQQPSPGGGWDGSGGGRPLPGEAEMAPEIEGAGRTPAEVRATRRQVAEAVREAVAKGRGNVPAGMARWAEEFLKPPKVDWRKKLGEVCRIAVKYRPGATDYAYSRPSRRQGAYGFGPGYPVLPDMVQPVPHVGIGIDTSGSMGPEDLGDAVSEADGVLKAIGAPAVFLACDAAVSEVRPVRTLHDLLNSLKGGGGTDFRPLFAAVEKLRPRPEVFVFATDGMGPAPARPPAGVKVIWLLVGKGATEPWFPDGAKPWGEMIRMERDDDEA